MNTNLGWGPGGQSVNKTTNAVFLRHLPTGTSSTSLST